MASFTFPWQLLLSCGKFYFPVTLVGHRSKQCFNMQFAHLSSVFCPYSFSRSWSPSSADASLLQSLNNNCPFTAPLQSSIQSAQFPLSEPFPFKKICMSPSDPISKNDCDLSFPTASTWHDFSQFRRKLHKLVFQFQFPVNCNCLDGTTSKALIAWTALLSGYGFKGHCWGLPIFMKSSKLVCRAPISVQTVSIKVK